MKHQHGRGKRATMKPVALTAAALAMGAAAPAMAEAKAPAGSGAQAADWKATVIAKDAQRGRVVTAGAGGEVRTLVTSKRVAGRTKLGQRVRVRAQRGADGTYEARRLRVSGKARRTQVRGAVVDRRADRFLLSAGGSVFAVKAGAQRKRVARASAAGFDTGDVVVTDVRINGDRLDAQRTRDVGDVTVVELEGLLTGIEDGVLDLAVEKRGLVKVAVPADMALVAPPVGEEIELLASIGADGAFTLVALDAGEDTGIDFDHEDGEVEVEGLITAVNDASVTVVGGGGASLTCAVPAGAMLTGFAAGEEAEMECAFADGALVLEELESETAEYEFDDSVEDEDSDDD